MGRLLSAPAKRRTHSVVARPRTGQRPIRPVFELPAGNGKPVNNGTPCPVSRPAAWELSAVDLTRLNKNDPACRRQINNAWRALKAEAGERTAAEIGGLFQALREHFPNAGLEVPAETLTKRN